jgi:hypothetical protein
LQNGRCGTRAINKRQLNVLSAFGAGKKGQQLANGRIAATFKGWLHITQQRVLIDAYYRICTKN